MLYIYDHSEASSLWTDDLVEEILQNRKIYCAKHNYTLVNGHSLVDPSRPVAWSKILAVKHFLSSFDYVFYIDMDIVIMNMEISLETFISSALKNKDFIMTTDWNGPNTGQSIVS